MLRSTLAALGFVVIAATGTSVAAPISPGPIGQAADQLGTTESVHCRPWRHWHRWGYSRGCGGVYFDEGVRIRRYGYGHRYYRGDGRFGVREDFRSGVTVRGERRNEGVRAGGSFRGTPGETTSRQTGASTRSGTGPRQGGSMNAAPSGGASGGATGGATGGASGGAGVGAGGGGNRQ